MMPTSSGSGQAARSQLDQGAGAAWEPGPLEPLLADRAVHVWRADLSSAGGELASLLSGDERERAAGMASEHDRQLWSRSRGVLRALLGRYLRAEPSAVRFAADTHGKLALAGDPHERPPLFFNLSHSQQLALFAFTEIGPVGVDIEVARNESSLPSAVSKGASSRPRPDRVALAKRVFGEQQAQRLQALEPEPREREFLRLWTRHEAELKRRGIGLSGLRTQTAEQACIVELDVAPAAAAAVACGLPPSELRRWDWI